MDPCMYVYLFINYPKSYQKPLSYTKNHDWFFEHHTPKFLSKLNKVSDLHNLTDRKLHLQLMIKNINTNTTDRSLVVIMFECNICKR